MGQPTPTPTTPPQTTIPGVSDVGALAQALDEYGPWAVAAVFIFGFAIVCYAYYRQGRRHEEARQQDTKQFIDILEKSGKVITSATDQLQRVESKLEKVTRSNDRTDAILDDHKKLIERIHQKLDNRS